MSGWRITSIVCRGTRPGDLPAHAGSWLLVFPADADGEALAGATAVATGAAVLGRITGCRRDGDALFATRSSHGGRLLAEFRLAAGLAVATANDFDGADDSIQFGEPEDAPLIRQPLTDQQTSLEGAAIVIGGGRGLDQDDFVQLDRIAAALGGAVSASLPAVDLGLAPVSRQVGQSGKFVNPQVYFAAGMSGTPQHFAGVGARARVIAVNKDSEAPIFAFAETGVVADAKDLLPLLADALEHRNKGR